MQEILCSRKGVRRLNAKPNNSNEFYGNSEKEIEVVLLVRLKQNLKHFLKRNLHASVNFNNIK